MKGINSSISLSLSLSLSFFFFFFLQAYTILGGSFVVEGGLYRNDLFVCLFVCFIARVLSRCTLCTQFLFCHLLLVRSHLSNAMSVLKKRLEINSMNLYFVSIWDNCPRYLSHNFKLRPRCSSSDVTASHHSSWQGARIFVYLVSISQSNYVQWSLLALHTVW